MSHLRRTTPRISNGKQPPTEALAPTLIKIGGHEIADDAFLRDLAQTVHAMPEPVVIVHGGGKEISDLQRTLGIEPHYIDGVRVTDGPSLAVVSMVLAGLVNKRLISYLVSAGVDAQGMSGVDRGLIRARQMPHASEDMGLTGDVISVRGDLLRSLLDQGVTPVIAPLCLGDAGTSLESIYNVNADHVAGAVGAAIKATRVVFITNVDGVMHDASVIPQMDRACAAALIDDGTINGGMIPKVTTALSVLDRGIPGAVITNLNGLKSGGGTTFTESTA